MGRIIIALTLCALALTSPMAQVIAPGLINYQGLLRDSGGQPLATADYEIVFNIYDTHQGGVAVWGPQTFDTVPVALGHFNVILGPEDDLARPLTSAFATSERYLGITVNGDEIGPRQQILSAPYALTANTAANGVPAGTIIAYGGDAVPDGWLACNGATVNRETYANLFDAIGTAWGSGDGSTTFNVPDLRGRFLRGVDDGAGRDPNAGSRSEIKPGGNTGDAVGSLQGDATARPNSNFTTNTTGNHSHSLSGVSGAGFTSGIDVNALGGSDSRSTGSTGNHSHSITGGGDAETRPINAAVEFLIKI